MKKFIRLTDYHANDIYDIFKLADEVRHGEYHDILKGKSVVLFFPNSSIRTRVTFEKGIHLLGGQSILFPVETLDKKEDLKDVCGYLDNWADMYALSKTRKDFVNDKFLFCGKKGNIGLTWKEASDVMGFQLEQCCGDGYEIDGLVSHNNIYDAIIGKDIVCTDSLPASVLDDFRECQITMEAMEMANAGAILNPCPPFYRGEEVSDDVIESNYFVGYEFKKYLLEVQQAIMIYCFIR